MNLLDCSLEVNNGQLHVRHGDFSLLVNAEQVANLLVQPKAVVYNWAFVQNI